MLLKMPSTDSSQPQCAGLGIQNQVFGPETITPRHNHQPSAPIGFNDARSVGSASSTYAPSPQAHDALPASSHISQHTGFSPAANFGRRHGSIGQHSMTSHSPAGDEKLELGYLLRQSGQTSGDQRQLHYGMERTPSVHSLNNKPMHTLSPFQNGQEEYSSVYAYPPRNVSQTCPLDGLLLKFLSDQRERVLHGVQTSEIIGPPYPSFRTLIDPQASEKSHALSRVFTDMLGKFPDISTLPEQVAILCAPVPHYTKPFGCPVLTLYRYIMFIIMRWQIHPTQETYDRLPDWITPRPSQLFTPHPAWVDHLPWPRMRDKLTRIYPTIPFDEFFIPYTTTVSLNWPYDGRDVLMAMPNTEELALNPVFERHLMDLGNWTLGERFARAHPQLADTFKMAVGDARQKYS